MRLWDPFDLHNSRPATAAVIRHAIGRIFFSELSLAGYNKIRLNLQFLSTNRVGRRGSGIVAFIKIDIRVCVCVAQRFIQYSICVGGALTLKRCESRPQPIDTGRAKREAWSKRRKRL